MQRSKADCADLQWYRDPTCLLLFVFVFFFFYVRRTNNTHNNRAATAIHQSRWAQWSCVAGVYKCNTRVIRPTAQNLTTLALAVAEQEVMCCFFVLLFCLLFVFLFVDLHLLHVAVCTASFLLCLLVAGRACGVP